MYSLWFQSIAHLNVFFHKIDHRVVINAIAVGDDPFEKYLFDKLPELIFYLLGRDTEGKIDFVEILAKASHRKHAVLIFFRATLLF